MGGSYSGARTKCSVSEMKTKLTSYFPAYLLGVSFNNHGTNCETEHLVDEVRADHTYFLSWDGQYLYLAGDIAATPLEHPPTKQARPWERDYLSIQLSPVKARETHAGSSPPLFIYPSQPHAARRYGPEGYRPMPLRVATRHSSRGFTIEARIPGTAIWGFKGRAGASWRIKLRYQNVQEIYQTTWQGIVTLRP